MPNQGMARDEVFAHLERTLHIASVGSAFPPHYYDQGQLMAAFRRVWEPRLPDPRRLLRIHRRVLVGGRYLALPMERYEELQGWGEANDEWIRVATDVGAAAIVKAMAGAGLELDQIDALYFVTVTGVAAPSVDALIINRLGLPPRINRVPIFGLGCVAGAAGLARVADYLRAWPDRVAVLLSVELCSLTLQQKDLSMANIIASGLFGDGAAAVVVTGAERSATGPRILDTASVFYPDSEDVMGWKISESGFQVVLSEEVPEMVTRYLRRDVDGFLAGHGLGRGDISCWIAHTGGPRVLEVMEEALELPPGALEISWRSLKEVGNLSSASVLLVLEEVLATRQPEPGSYGLLMAMGPGFCSELVLLRW